MDKKRRRHFMIIFFCLIICVWFGWRWYNHYTVPKDMEPLVCLDTYEHTVTLYYLQNKEFITIPSEIMDEYVGQSVTLNGEEILIVIRGDNPKLISYNYVTGEMKQKGDLTELPDYSGGIEAFRFVPNSENISFIYEEKIWVYNSEEQRYQTVYDYSDITSRLGYPYEWKNEKEIYLLHDKNIVLYNIETKQLKTIVEDVGSVYFKMSDDRSYAVIQSQKRERDRKIYVINMDSGEKRQIHTARSTHQIDFAFYGDNQYIFLVDRPEDTYRAKIYCYLYDMNEQKKYRLDSNTEKKLYWYGLVVGSVD